ncbi:MAG: ATP-dependent protease ATPase subunit HslU [Bacillota bacterium]
MKELTPARVVAELSQYVIGQEQAKRAVAVALRNRYRRRLLAEELRDEVVPKNILMIGPTGVGKTEIARRLARLVQAPFIKVEATKYTEVGYVGRDVESMVRDLVETSVRMVRAERLEEVRGKAGGLARERLLDLLAPLPRRDTGPRNPLEALLGGAMAREEDAGEFAARLQEAVESRQRTEQRLDAGELEGETVQLEVDDTQLPTVEVFSGAGVEELGINFQDMLGGLLPRRKKVRRVQVAEARRLLGQEEADKLVDADQAAREGLRRAEEDGIIFIDEFDKIAGREQGAGPDVSREGVQRDILPIVEGSTVMTKYGPARTDHVLFIAAGAFHASRPSDLIPELQGRFPIRVGLSSLSEEDFVQILTEPRTALLRQYHALLAVDGVHLEFTPDGIRELAHVAWQVNMQAEDIGARRLHTVLEKLLEDVSYGAPETAAGLVSVDRDYVRDKLAGIAGDQDLSRYIL